MSETVYNKLVRDKIPEIIQAKGDEPVTHVLDREAFIAALDEKLLEEVREYLAEPSVEELADIIEVLEAILAAREISQPTLRRAKNVKALKRGSFLQRIYLEKVIHPEK